jgi:hypothetical protein
MRSSFAGDETLSSIVAQARDAVGKLGIGIPGEPPASAALAATAPELRHGAGAGRPVGPVPADVPRLVSRGIGSSHETSSRGGRRARPLMPALVEPPSSADLSARSADEPARETETLTIYSTRDTGVEPPVLLYPQIPTNLMLAGENRMNIMEIVVSETGAVERVRLVAGPSRLPDVMLLSGAKAWRFKPAARRRGRPLSRTRQLGWDAMNIVWTGSRRRSLLT